MSLTEPLAPPLLVTKAASYRVKAPLIGPPHSHPGEWQVVYVVSAAGRIQIGDIWHDVRPRDLYLIRPGVAHASEDDTHARPALWELRMACPADSTLPVPVADLPCVFREIQEPALLEVMRQLIDEYSARQSNWQWLCAILAQELLLRIARLATEDATRAPSEVHRLHAETMAGIRRYIHFHFDEPLTVKLLARQAGMSSRRFAAVFRQVCGKPPLQYVIDMRMNRAAELLREGRWTVSEVASLTGFSSVHYFSRAFGRHRGMPPSEYKLTALIGDDKSGQ